MTAPRQRTIVIGTVECKFLVIRNSGFPDCFEMTWRGHVDWCQPFQFVQDRGLWSAVRIRLGMAGLRLVAGDYQLPKPHQGSQPLRIKVQRLAGRAYAAAQAVGAAH